MFINSRAEKVVVYLLQWNVHSSENGKKTRTTLKIWFNLTNIILGEIIQTQKRIHFIKFEKNKSYLCCFKSGISYLHREISDCKWLQWGFGSADNVLCLDLSEKSLASLQKYYQSNTVNERIYTTTVFSRIHLLTQWCEGHMWGLPPQIHMPPSELKKAWVKKSFLNNNPGWKSSSLTVLLRLVWRGPQLLLSVGSFLPIVIGN